MDTTNLFFFFQTNHRFSKHSTIWSLKPQILLNLGQQLLIAVLVYITLSFKDHINITLLCESRCAKGGLFQSLFQALITFPKDDLFFSEC